MFCPVLAPSASFYLCESFPVLGSYQVGCVSVGGMFYVRHGPFVCCSLCNTRQLTCQLVYAFISLHSVSEWQRSGLWRWTDDVP